MNLMDLLNSATGAGANQAIAAKLGLDQSQAKAVMEKLVPALSAGLKKNAAQPGGMDAMLNALQKGGHSRYLEQPAALTEASGIQDGNAILGHIFGSKQVSRDVAARASASTGVDTNLIKQMLPMVAAAMMGAMGQQSQTAARGGGNPAGMLGSLLDSDGDGSVADDLLGMAGKFFGR